MPLPVNVTTSAGTVTYITLSAVNTTHMPGNLTVLQVRVTFSPPQQAMHSGWLAMQCPLTPSASCPVELLH